MRGATGAKSCPTYKKLICPQRNYALCDYCSSDNPCGGYVNGWDTGDCGAFNSKDEWTCYNFGEQWDSGCIPESQLPSCPTTLSGCAPTSGSPALLLYEISDSRVETCPSACTPTSWWPAPNTVCSGIQYNQVSDCGSITVKTGTKVCGTMYDQLSCKKKVFANSTCAEEPVCPPEYNRIENWIKCCPSWTWLPATSSVCAGVSFTQRSDCGTRPAVGTMDCSVSCSWTPATSTVCSGTTFTQTDGCGGSQTAVGTKDCSVPCTVVQLVSRYRHGLFRNLIYPDK